MKEPIGITAQVGSLEEEYEYQITVFGENAGQHIENCKHYVIEKHCESPILLFRIKEYLLIRNCKFELGITIFNNWNHPIKKLKRKLQFLILRLLDSMGFDLIRVAQIFKLEKK